MTKMDNSHCVVGIVEDDRAVRDALCNLLSSVGLHVAAFGSAEELIRVKYAACLNQPGPGGSCSVQLAASPG